MAMLVMLGTPAPTALAATLLFRVFSLWIPLLLESALIRRRPSARPR